MRATALEFRLRMAIMVFLVVLGFWAPWIEYLNNGAWDWAGASRCWNGWRSRLSRTGLLPLYDATPVVIVVAALVAAAGMILRVWGAAYLGYGTVHHRRCRREG